MLYGALWTSLSHVSMAGAANEDPVPAMGDGVACGVSRLLRTDADAVPLLPLGIDAVAPYECVIAPEWVTGALVLVVVDDVVVVEPVAGMAVGCSEAPAAEAVATTAKAPSRANPTALPCRLATFRRRNLVMTGWKMAIFGDSFISVRGRDVSC
jgi:hypothetical protein